MKKIIIIAILMLSMAGLLLAWMFEKDRVQVLSDEESTEYILNLTIKKDKNCQEKALKLLDIVKKNFCQTNNDCILVSLDCFIQGAAINKSVKESDKKLFKTVNSCLTCENVDYISVPSIAICEKNKCIVKQCEYGKCD